MRHDKCAQFLAHVRQLLAFGGLGWFRRVGGQVPLRLSAIIPNFALKPGMGNRLLEVLTEGSREAPKGTSASRASADCTCNQCCSVPGISVDDLMLWAARGIYANPLLSQSQAVSLPGKGERAPLEFNTLPIRSFPG